MSIKTAFLLSFVFTRVLLAAPDRWVVTWGASASPQRTDAQMRDEQLIYQNQTLREIVHSSIGGKTVRVRLSNAYGKQTAEIGAAHIALSTKKSGIVTGSDHVLTFSGQTTIAIPPNAVVVSDPVKLDVLPAHDVTISLFLPKATVGGGIHYAAQQTTYIGNGDLTGSVSIPDATTVESWVFLSDLDVRASDTASTLIAFGDSITDGAKSTTDANHRWPNFLADRLSARRGDAEIGILDAGIGGNRILHDAITNVRFGVNALARFDRDVLSQPGVHSIIVLEGINDLGHAGPTTLPSEVVSAEEIIAGLQQMADRAHENGLKIFGATLTPFEGTIYPGYFTPDKEVKRKAVNEWIRTGKAFDAVIDFDKAVRDPNHPDRMLAAYDSGDHLHPNDAGYKAMADSIDLSLFK
jgi:lysophospholipase L1-like esterase